MAFGATTTEHFEATTIEVTTTCNKRKVAKNYNNLTQNNNNGTIAESNKLLLKVNTIWSSTISTELLLKVATI